MTFVIVAIIIIAVVFILWKTFKKSAPSEEKLKKQQEAYEALLKKYDVPEEHCRFVIAQSGVFKANNCPAVLWKEENTVKTLVLKPNPILASDEVEDFLFLSSHPYFDFKRLDGTDAPDWAVQSDYVKQLFLPYVDVADSRGGIDRKKQMYWVGTMCLYAPSVSEVLKLIGRPLSDYTIHVENKKLMKSDGSIPEEIF